MGQGRMSVLVSHDAVAMLLGDAGVESLHSIGGTSSSLISGGVCVVVAVVVLALLVAVAGGVVVVRAVQTGAAGDGRWQQRQ